MDPHVIKNGWSGSFLPGGPTVGSRLILVSLHGHTFSSSMKVAAVPK